MEGLVPRFELDTPQVNSEAPIGLIKKTSTKKDKHQHQSLVLPDPPYPKGSCRKHQSPLPASRGQFMHFSIKETGGLGDGQIEVCFFTRIGSTGWQ